MTSTKVASVVHSVEPDESGQLWHVWRVLADGQPVTYGGPESPDAYDRASSKLPIVVSLRSDVAEDPKNLAVAKSLVTDMFERTYPGTPLDWSASKALN